MEAREMTVERGEMLAALKELILELFGIAI